MEYNLHDTTVLNENILSSEEQEIWVLYMKVLTSSRSRRCVGMDEAGYEHAPNESADAIKQPWDTESERHC